MIRVFIEEVPCIGIEVLEQLLDRSEAVGRFRGALMAVIAFAGLVVIAQHAFFLVDQCQSFRTSNGRFVAAEPEPNPIRQGSTALPEWIASCAADTPHTADRSPPDAAIAPPFPRHSPCAPSPESVGGRPAPRRSDRQRD